MDPERNVKLIKDSQGRKLLVEVSGNLTLEKASGQDEEDLYEPTHAADDISAFANSLNELISDTTSTILDSIMSLKRARPSKVQVEFGVGLGAEGTVWFIAKGSVNSSIKVSIEWGNLNLAEVPEQ